MEVLVEESMEKVTRKIMIYLGYHPVRGRNPLRFKDRGPNADNQEIVARRIVGA